MPVRVMVAIYKIGLAENFLLNLRLILVSTLEARL